MKVVKKILDSSRVRRIDGGFIFIPHKFLTDGFVSSLGRDEILVYFLLVLVSDRNGLSYYSQDRLSGMLKMDIDEFMLARDGLIKKSLIAFDGLIFQVLSLPEKPVAERTARPADGRQSSATLLADIIKRTSQSKGGHNG